MEAIMGEIYLAAIEGDLEKLSAFDHEELVDECVNMARCIVELQSYIAFSGQEKKMCSQDLVNSLKREVEELKAKHPGGRSRVYTTGERKSVVDLRKSGTSYDDICMITGMSKNTVTRIIREAKNKKEL